MATAESQSLTDIKLLRLIEEAIQKVVERSGGALALTNQDVLFKEYARLTAARLQTAGKPPCERCRGSGTVLSDMQSTRPLNNKASTASFHTVDNMVLDVKVLPHGQFYALSPVYTQRKKRK